MDVPEISPADALKSLDAAAFIDVRDAGSWRSSHIPGALNVGDHNIGDFVASADKTRPTIVCCYHGNSSIGGAAYLLEQGFSEVYSLRGGFAAWHGNPTESAAPPAPPTPRPARVHIDPPKRESRRRRWLARIRSLKGR
jgi:thiosulfate sulfurtransferase